MTAHEKLARERKVTDLVIRMEQMMREFGRSLDDAETYAAMIRGVQKTDGLYSPDTKRALLERLGAIRAGRLADKAQKVEVA